KKHECTVCGRGPKNGMQIPDGDLLCPFCGGRFRTRRLSNFVIQKDFLHGRILHCSPSQSLYRKVNKITAVDYFQHAYEDEFIADYRYDITDIPLENDYFDVIICYHILEHIEDDKKAMKELFRVLKPNGSCVIQTPFKEGEIYEDFSIRNPKERLFAFGQEDHVRIYSVNALQKRLLDNDFHSVEIKTFPSEERYGLMEETVLIAKK